MQPLKPCARCEQELPEAFFDSRDAMFCKRCNDEVNDILRSKYSIIEAAHFRAQMRLSTKRAQDRMKTRETRKVAAGD
jgi:hypothetical protein